MQTVQVNSSKKKNRIMDTLKKQGRTGFYEKYYYSNFPAKGFGSYYVIYYKEV